MDEQKKLRYGWICPRCNSVLAPWVDECSHCNTNRKQTVPPIPANEDWLNAYNQGMVSEQDDPEPVRTIMIDPNTQCVDCQHGTIIHADVPNAEPFIQCHAFSTIRTVNDTCIAQIQDLNTMTAGERE